MSSSILEINSEASSNTSNFNSVPQVLHLEDRGDCAIEYIELFDEGRYGADKLFWRGRFKTLSEVRDQISVLLQIGSPLDKEVDLNVTKDIVVGQDTSGNDVVITMPNILAFKRWNSDTYRDAVNTKDLRDKWPAKAHFPINILLRVKFYSDFAYINIGDKWGSLYEDDMTKTEVKPEYEQYLPTMNGKNVGDYYSLSYETGGISVISYSCISLRDAENILSTILDSPDDTAEREKEQELAAENMTYVVGVKPNYARPGIDYVLGHEGKRIIIPHVQPTP